LRFDLKSSDTAYYPTIKIRVKSLSIHPGIFRVHLYPLSFRNLHAHLNSHFACVRGESFLASYYPVSVSSVLRRRLEDRTKNSLPPNLFPTRYPRSISSQILRIFRSARSRSVGELVRKRHDRPRLRHNFDFELKKLGKDEEWWPYSVQLLIRRIIREREILFLTNDSNKERHISRAFSLNKEKKGEAHLVQ